MPDQLKIHTLIGLFWVVANTAFGQIVRPDHNLTPENLQKHKITAYTDTWVYYNSKKDITAEYMIVQKQFNEAGQTIFEWNKIFDIQEAIDSSVYSYSARGKLTSIVKYRTFLPKNTDKKGVTEGVRPADTVKINYYYPRDPSTFQMIKHDKKALNKVDTTQYVVDGDGRVLFEENSRKKLIYTYSQNGRLDKKVQYNKKYISKPGKMVFEITDTLITRFIYDKEGRLTKEATEFGSVTYVYNEKSELIKAFESGKMYGRPYDYSYEFAYDEKGNLIDMKKFKSGDLWDWERYEYNEMNFCVKQYYLDINTKEVKVMIKRELIAR